MFRLLDKIFGRNGLLNRGFIGFIRVYQLLIAPLFPPACRYYPSCSRYAVDALRKRPLHIAIAKTIWRLLRCNPFSRGGYDPVDPD
jgi:putative membrane protein insertion efficiency factor